MKSQPPRRDSVANAIEWLKTGFPVWATDIRCWYPVDVVVGLLNQLFIKAHTLGMAEPEDLVRCAAEFDYLGVHEEAINLNERIRRQLAARPNVNPQETATICTNKAMFFEHASAEIDDKSRAIELLEEGRKCLRAIVPDDPDLVGQSKAEFGEKYWRAVYHLAILTRREWEIRRSFNERECDELLSEAQSRFREVHRYASREDSRISALHQPAICDLLCRRLHEAEYGLKQCCGRWEQIGTTQDHRGSSEDVSIRKAFEHRRLAHVLAKRGECKSARKEFEDVRSMCVSLGFKRYVDQISRDIKRFKLLS